MGFSPGVLFQGSVLGTQAPFFDPLVRGPPEKKNRIPTPKDLQRARPGVRAESVEADEIEIHAPHHWETTWKPIVSLGIYRRSGRKKRRVSERWRVGWISQPSAVAPGKRREPMPSFHPRPLTWLSQNGGDNRSS